MNEELKVIIRAEIGELKKALNEATNETKKYEKETSKAVEAVKKVFSGLGKVGLEAGKTIAKGIGVGVAALGGLGVAALKSYADYEQLVGGIETLFGSSAGVVQGYAEQAYKTAGLSANQYMETITGFSASLLQSLGGDTAKAAEIGNQAVIDMSDNANKMGTSMESIQNAYQGFAKQNYTMLDNLKLGYGGTKEEMQRLLDDASKLPAAMGQKFDISNYADVVQAIHLVQTEMGITGTTAKEASSTISGSINTMKGALSNLVAGLMNGSADIGKLVDDVVDSALTVVDNIAPKIQTFLPNIVNGITKLTNQLLPKIPEILQQLLPGLVKGAVQLIQDIVAIAPNLIQTLMDILPIVIEGITQIMISLMEELPNILMMLVEALPSLIQPICDALPVLLPQLLQAALTLIISLMENFSTIIQPIITMLPELITNIVNTLIANLPALINGVIQLVLGIVGATGQIIQLLVPMIPQIIGDIVKAIIENIPVIIEGVLQIVTSVMELIGTLAASIWDAICGLWDTISGLLGSIGNWIYNNVIAPVGNFFSGLWKTITGIFSSVGSWFGNKFKEAWTAIKNAFSSVGSFFTGIWTNIKNIFSKVGSAIGTAVSNAFSKAINWVLEKAIGIINGFISAINAAISVINLIPGVNISKIKKLEVPKMAQGGVVNKATLAMIGENGKEAVVPLEKNLGWMDKLADMLSERMNIGSGEQNIIMQVDGKTFAKVACSSINNLTRQTGALPLILA